ncbi:hypothetical protein WJX79_008036 [Trebouxia sp. C0005]
MIKGQNQRNRTKESNACRAPCQTSSLDGRVCRVAASSSAHTRGCPAHVMPLVANAYPANPADIEPSQRRLEA